MEQANTPQTVKIDATGIYYRELNARLRELVSQGVQKIEIVNSFGQRYIGTDLEKPVTIEITGTPGNDLGSFMDGPTIIVHGNAQDGTGNTMNAGKIIVHGRAGDTTMLSARGGEVYIRDSVGYRAGIHIKEYGDRVPVLVIGGTAQDFVGEYMAGGVLVLLGINIAVHPASYIGTGMHGGTIFIRGQVEEHQLGKEVGVAKPDEKDRRVLDKLIREYCHLFNYDVDALLQQEFIKLYPKFLRPYGKLYTN
jgi:glutamate synthase domain-containing protein 3